MKRQILLILVSGALGLLLTGLILWGLSPDVTDTQAAAPAAPQQEVFWEEDFSEVLSPSIYYTTATPGSGLVDNSSFLLTQDTTYQRGRIFYRTLYPMTEFHASFRLYLGQNSGGADGAAFIFCPSYDYPPGNGGTLDASCPDGYIVAFDTYEEYGNRVYVAFGNTGNRLDEHYVFPLEDGEWHNAEVIFDQGTITVSLDSYNVIDGYTIPDYEPFFGYFGFSAATGALSNEQRVDDIYIGPHGQLDGHVYDAETMAPIFDATITAESPGNGSWSDYTNYSGYYSMMVPPGTYTVTAESQNYLTNFVTGVEVISDALTTVDLYLTARLDFEPTPLQVTLDWQTTHAMTATVLNRSNEPFDFWFYDIPSDGNSFNDVPWFGQDPSNGSVPPSTTVPGELDASMLFTATYSAGVDQPGDYYATLLLSRPEVWILQVPVTMTVLPPDNMGKVEGNVTDNCTADPLADVDISILSGDPITQTWTENEGDYTAWLFEGSYELVFSTTGYLPFTGTVDILAGQVTPLDVILEREGACIVIEPERFEAWLVTGTPVYTHTPGLEITNIGSTTLTFQIYDSHALVAAGGNRGIESLSGSYVAFDPFAGGDPIFIPGGDQTFCFRAESYTDDNEYVANLWQSFPTDWIVSNVYVQGTPTCDAGGTWGTFGWDFHDSNPYEINISHPRFQAAPSDHCVAHYCFDVTSGISIGDTFVSWYWAGDAWGDVPHHPCSYDGYTPSGQPECDEAINPEALIPGDILWLWEEPTSGTVPVMSSLDVDIMFTASVTSLWPPGNYTATLWVASNDWEAGLQALPVTMHVVEAFSDPTTAFESNTPVLLGETTVFTNTSMEGLPPTENYLWDFGDGTTMTTTTTETVTHSYTTGGSYTVTLTAYQMQTGVEVTYMDDVMVWTMTYLPIVNKE